MIWYGLLLDVVSVAIVSVIRVRGDTDEVRATAAAPLVSLYSISVKTAEDVFRSSDCASDKL